MRLHAGFHL
jgi:hypothetical protein